MFLGFIMHVALCFCHAMPGTAEGGEVTGVVTLPRDARPVGRGRLLGL